MRILFIIVECCAGALVLCAVARLLFIDGGPDWFEASFTPVAYSLTVIGNLALIAGITGSLLGAAW